jgi:hypothetical protein
VQAVLTRVAPGDLGASRWRSSGEEVQFQAACLPDGAWTSSSGRVIGTRRAARTKDEVGRVSGGRECGCACMCVLCVIQEQCVHRRRLIISSAGDEAD